jgi:hypothetical protein
MREKHKIKKTFKYTFISFLFEVGIIATLVFLFAGSISYKIINNDIDTVPYLKINGESYEINNNSCKLTTNCFNLEVKKGDKIIFEKLPFSISNSGNINEYSFSEDNWLYTVHNQDTEFILSAENFLYNFKVIANE